MIDKYKHILKQIRTLNWMQCKCYRWGCMTF